MLQARDLIEHQILWQTRRGTTSVWHDNWTGLGDIYTIRGDNWEWDERYKKIEDVTNQGEWDIEVMQGIFPTEIVEHILTHIKPPRGRIEKDKPLWMLESRGEFTVKSAWNYIRHKEDPNRVYK